MLRKIAGTGAAVLIAATAWLVAGAADAHAVSYDGRITARPSLAVRFAPSVHAVRVGTLASGDRVPLGCWVLGTSIDGDRTWYSLPTDAPGGQWFAGRYVRLLGSKPPRCTGDRATGRTIAALAVRTGPNTADARIRTVASGTILTIICKQPAQRIDGNNRWYWTRSRGWVSARYVRNLGPAPDWCRWPS